MPIYVVIGGVVILAAGLIIVCVFRRPARCKGGGVQMTIELDERFVRLLNNLAACTETSDREDVIRDALVYWENINRLMREHDGAEEIGVYVASGRNGLLQRWKIHSSTMEEPAEVLIGES